MIAAALKWRWLARWGPVLAAAVTLAAGCGGDDADAPQLPNPASAFCVEQGGTVTMVSTDEGAQAGRCRLSDGTEVDEWEYYRSKHPEEDDR
ncbi:MAG: DUF333 domain-containing protein [Acidimicrobiales bacterium]